jgi:hypothetical protein
MPRRTPRRRGRTSCWSHPPESPPRRPDRQARVAGRPTARRDDAELSVDRARQLREAARAVIGSRLVHRALSLLTSFQSCSALTRSKIEDEVSFGRGEATEVEQVRVAGQLRRQAGVRPRGEVVRHHGGPTAEEGERRREHAAVANRDEVRHARPVLRLEQRDRIAIGVDLELRMGRSRYPAFSGASPSGARTHLATFSPRPFAQARRCEQDGFMRPPV